MPKHHQQSPTVKTNLELELTVVKSAVGLVNINVNPNMLPRIKEN